MAHAQFVNESVNRNVTRQLSYANAVNINRNTVNSNARVQVNNNPPASNNMLKMLDDEAYINFGCSFITLENKFVNYMTNLKNSKNSHERSIALLNFISDTRFNGLQ